MMSNGWRRRAVALGAVAAVALLVSATSASADTRVMRNRQALRNTGVVFWGNTTLANGTAFSMDCGNGDVTNGAVADQSYITKVCTYAVAATFTATLTVGGESASAQIMVVDGAVQSAQDLRNIRINMAIEDGLRFLYFNQFNRAARFNTNTTSWQGANTFNDHNNAFTALAVQALQNHGHHVDNPPSDIMQPVVQRGLNYLFNALAQQDMTPCAEPGGNPCIGVPAPVNIGLRAPTGLSGYATPIFAAAIAGAAAADPTRTVGAGLGANNAGFVVGKTYAEVLQRVANAVVWGQSDAGLGRGGWYYNLEAGSVSDGSTMGWGLLGLIDASAAGATVPNFAKTEFANLMQPPASQLNNDGSLDYQVNGNVNPNGSMTKNGIGLQGLAWIGVPQADARVQAVLNNLSQNWINQVTPGWDGFQCQAGTPTARHRGCGYAMFNIFKGLRLYGIQTLPGVNRPAGPGTIPANDWYADYVDILLANQHTPTSPTAGEWGQNAAPTTGWSCCENDTSGITSLALLILSPVAFVLPDPTLFATVGLGPASATNLLNTNHTVTATAKSSNQQPVPGAVVTFNVISGPNSGETGQAVTNANGQAQFTYTGDSGAGVDQIQAFIGTLASNVVTKTWVPEVSACDADGDKNIDTADLTIIRNANGQNAASANDPRDGNKDGKINVLDVRYCQLRCTKAGCAQ